MSIRRITALFGAAIVAACSSSERAGFDESAPPDAPRGSSDFFGQSTMPTEPETNECATANAEAQKPPVDIIMSVDQSGSMGDDLANVKANINELSQFLSESGLDVRVVMIGTVGTGTYDICVPPPLGGPNCTSNGDRFRTVNSNVQSSDTLNIILTTLSSTTTGTMWLDFLRKDSVKVFVPITDDNSYLAAKDFDSQLLDKSPLFGTAKARRYAFYPIVGAAAYPSETTCGSNAVNPGSVYLDLAKLTKGRWYPICSKDFGPVFQDMAKDIGATIACDLAVPKPTNGDEIDYEKVNVTVTADGGKTTDIFQDASKPCAEGANGWQYSDDRSRVLLCGAACEATRANDKAKVSIEFGCATRVR
jgi:hypothetical protein